eukprot:6476255-Amphidinium_carterae.1
MLRRAKARLAAGDSMSGELSWASAPDKGKPNCAKRALGGLALAGETGLDSATSRNNSGVAAARPGCGLSALPDRGEPTHACLLTEVGVTISRLGGSRSNRLVSIGVYNDGSTSPAPFWGRRARLLHGDSSHMRSNKEHRHKHP